MLSFDDRLGFLVRFVRMNLKDLRHTDLLRLRTELGQFLGRDPGRIHEKKTAPWGILPGSDMAPGPEKMTEADFRKLQRNVKALLEELMKKTVEWGTPMQGTPPVRIAASYQLWFPNRGRFLLISGRTQDMVLLTSHLLLVRGGADKIRRCPAPQSRKPGEQCGTFFVRRRKQIYCSEQCTDRAGKQRAA